MRDGTVLRLKQIGEKNETGQGKKGRTRDLPIGRTKSILVTWHSKKLINED
jgi:hypothetical protein